MDEEIIAARRELERQLREMLRALYKQGLIYDQRTGPAEAVAQERVDERDEAA